MDCAISNASSEYGHAKYNKFNHSYKSFIINSMLYRTLY